jgi:hypothetical protein
MAQITKPKQNPHDPSVKLHEVSLFTTSKHGTADIEIVYRLGEVFDEPSKPYDNPGKEADSIKVQRLVMNVDECDYLIRALSRVLIELGGGKP